MSNWWTSVNTAIHLVMGGGLDSLSSRNRGDYDGSLHMRQVTEWYSIHFGCYFCNILVMIFGELSNKGKKPPKRLKGIEPGSIPRKNETLPTVLVGPPRLQKDSRLPSTQSAPPTRQRLVRGSDLGCWDVGT